MGEWADKTKLEEQTLSFFLRGLKTLWELLYGEKKTMLWVVFWIAFIQALALVFQLILKNIIDGVPEILRTGSFSGNTIWLLAALAAVKLSALVLQRFALEIKFLKAMIRLENLWPVVAQEKLLGLSLSYHEKENTGKKISKINKGCERLVDIVGRLRWGFLPHFFYISINLAILLFLDPRIFAVFLLPFLPAGYLYLKAFRTAAPAFELWEEKRDVSSGFFCQSIIGITTVQNYVQEKREKESFQAIRKEMVAIDTKASIRMQMYFFAAVFCLWSFFLLSIFLSLYLLSRGETSVGMIIYLITTGSVTLEGLWGLIHEYTEILRRMIAVARMKELLDEQEGIKNAPNAIRPDTANGDLEISRLYFSYPGKERRVLKDINLKIQKGQMIALVGRSGEGKTTLVRLIARMFDPTGGKILFGGYDTKKLDLYWYRRNFAIVQQDVDIFDAKIIDNIRYSHPEAKREDVLLAVKAAHLDEALGDKNRFPKGLDEEVGERGVRLSGGERQRVGIARAYLALMHGAGILVLDEATSNLDSEAERAIQEMIKNIRKKNNITIIAIAHRLSTICRADMIYILNEGRITEQGNHKKLVQKNGLYARLVNLQRLGEIRT